MKHLMNALHRELGILGSSATADRLSHVEKNPAVCGDIPAITASCLKKMQDWVLTNIRKSLLRRHFFHLQSGCVFLLDELSKRRETMAPERYEMLAQCLASILRHLENRYPAFFNQKLAIPKIELAAASAQLAGSLPVLKALLWKHQVNSALSGVILEVFERFIRGTSCSYEQMQYITDMECRLRNLLQQRVAGPAEEPVRELLFELNFNCRTYIHYCQRALETALADCYAVQAQTDLLRSYRKFLRQVTAPKNTAYDSGQPGLRNQLLRFVRIALRERKLQKGNTILTTGHYRVRVNISSGQLVYLFRLLTELDIVVAQPRMALLTFIAAHFETPKTRHELLSAASLNNKYKCVNQSTAMQLKALLRKLVGKIETDFEKEN